MLCEDVEDDGGAVDHLHFGGVFQCASLARRQIIVDDDGVRLVLGITIVNVDAVA